MSAAYLVIYDGHPDDPEAFLAYYLGPHTAIIRRWPRIRGIELDVAEHAHDPASTTGGVFMVARFLFDSVADLRTALKSPERAEARADRDRMPAFRGTVRHQAVEIRKVT
jgi:uncharacterized protein (TIGR02118 family)